ncbi:MAG TPA: hypothetical protein VII43_05220 [Opitutaceae bacterium]
MRKPTRSLARRIGWGALLAAACAASQGCGPPDPLEMTVDADSSVGFAMWKNKAADHLDAAQMADFEEAVREFKYEAMAKGAASGSEAVGEAALQAVNGHTVRDVMEMGLGWELSRLQAERRAQGTAASGNARARTKPGDTASAEFLQDLVQRQEARVREMDKEIASVRRKLVALDPKWNKTEPTRPPVEPTPSQPSVPSPVPPDSPPQRIGCGIIKTQTPAET